MEEEASGCQLCKDIEIQVSFVESLLHAPAMRQPQIVM